MVSEEEFLDLCGAKDGEAAVRKVLEKQPELAKCVDTRFFREGHTALRAACGSGCEEVARVLLAFGAEVHAQDKHGETPLHYASSSGHEEVVRLLLEHGAEGNVHDAYGWTPLHRASYNGHEKVARLLFEHGADVNVQKSDGRLPLHAACAQDHEAMAQLLLEHGAEVNAQGKDNGWTPLHHAAFKGYARVARLLLEHGADRSITSHRGETARDVAKRFNELELLALLDTYFPITLQMVQMLLGLRGADESPLARFAWHSAFEPKVLSLVKCLLTGEESPAFEQLQREAWG